MEIILLDDVVGLGEAGTVVKVKNGYARNYLIPQGLAQKANAEVLNRVHLIKRAGEERRRKRIREVKDKISAMAGKRVVVPMKVGADTKLFGAVTTMLISERIAEDYDLVVDRRFVELAEPIKYLGHYEVKLHAGSEAPATIHVMVVDESTYFAEGVEAAVAAVAGRAVTPKAEEAAAPSGAAGAEETAAVRGVAEKRAPSADAGPPAETDEDADAEAESETEEDEEA